MTTLAQTKKDKRYQIHFLVKGIWTPVPNSKIYKNWGSCYNAAISLYMPHTFQIFSI